MKELRSPEDEVILPAYKGNTTVKSEERLRQEDERDAGRHDHLQEAT